MGDSTWNWKVTTKVPGSKAQHDVKSLTRKIKFLNATKIPLDMPSTQILCKGSFKCKDWLNGIPAVGGLSGWDREGNIFNLGGQWQYVDQIKRDRDARPCGYP